MLGQNNNNEINDNDTYKKQVSNWYKKNRSLVLRQSPIWAQGITIIAISLGSMAVLAGFLFRIDEVVSARGQLKAFGGTIDLTSPIDGKVEKILFDDNQNVKKGELLIKIDASNALIEKKLLEKQVIAEKDSLINSLEVLNLQMKSIESTKRLLESKVNTKTTILSDLDELVRVGGYQRTQYLYAQEDLLVAQNDLEEAKQNINQLNLRKNELILQSSRSIDQIKARLGILDYTIKNQKIYSPTKGIILEPTVREDLPIYKGERLLSIVPINKPYAEVRVSNKDIGFVKIGQPVSIRIDAFPFTTFGELDGKVTQIAADAKPLEDNLTYAYPVKIALENTSYNKFKELSLTPGMSLQVNMIIRDKPVISLISDIFTRQVDSVKSIRSEQ